MRVCNMVYWMQKERSYRAIVLLSRRSVITMRYTRERLVIAPVITYLFALK